MREPYIDVAVRYTSAMPVATPVQQFFALRTRTEHASANRQLVAMFRAHGAVRARVRQVFARAA